MNRAEQRAGQPLVVLAAVLIGWVAIRAAVWQFGDRGINPPSLPLAGDFVVSTGGLTPPANIVSPPRVQPTLPDAPSLEQQALDGARRDTWDDADVPPGTEGAPAFLVQRSLSSPRGQRMPSGEASAHSLLWFAAMAQVPMADELRLALAKSAEAKSSGTPGRRRWFSGDGWLFLREGGAATPGGGPGGPAYGQSQVGAVLWWDAAPGTALRPRMYLRGTKALAGDGAGEAALGLSMRPAERMPIVLHAEMRATVRPQSHELRPALFVTAGGEREGLPLGLAVRGYGQAGWVGGDFQTGFVDGSVTARREVARFDLGRVDAGAGLWGGAQKGASRLDIGPSASLDLDIGDAPIRVSADYRIRVAGDAAPPSGAALTLSTGF